MKRYGWYLFFAIVLVVAISANTNGNKEPEEKKEVFTPCVMEQHDTIYLYEGESVAFSYGGKSEDGKIANIIGNRLFGLGNGKTRIIIDECNHYDVVVSNLYIKPAVNNDKPFLTCGIYSVEDNLLLDEIMASKIEKAGYHTRAGVVEAARFLTLSLPYRLNYYYENGRLSSNYKIDGEGRYYHTGLYLSEAKYDEISKHTNGPACWGCKLLESGGYYAPNGLDCSGFVSWALLNGGYDCGDIGAGPTEVLDFTDLGEKKFLRNVDIEEIKVGDLIGFNGHIGIIIGDDGENIYVAEDYWFGDLNVEAYSYADILSGKEWFYVMLMDSYYGEDGNLTDYWG